MGYTTTYMDKTSAIIIIKVKKVEVVSASDVKYFNKYPRINEIVSAEKSNHGHIILNLRKGFVDYKII